jgi:hypothetical protein
MITLTSKELTGMYLYLKENQESLDTVLDSLLHRIEKVLYQYVSIGELEGLREKYNRGFDILAKKGY